MEPFVNASTNIFHNTTDVIVVGGGISGVTALKMLLDLGINAFLLEAQSRIGGRISTHKIGNSVIEDGAEWVHGEENNPLFRLARNENQLAPAVSDDAWGIIIRRSDGTSQPKDEDIVEKLENLMELSDTHGILEPYYGKGYGSFYIDKLKNKTLFDQEDPDLPAWSHYIHLQVNSYEGTPNWMDINAYDADNWISYGNDRKWKNGYDFVFKYLTKDINPERILLSSPVRKIKWDNVGSNEVLVKTDSSEYVAKHVIVTTSIGYLKKNHESLFDPPLPKQLISDYNGIELGGPNKVWIGWDAPWWEDKYLLLKIIWTKRDLPRKMEWMYGLAFLVSAPEYPSKLLGFVAGDYSTAMVDLTENEVRDHLYYLLIKLLPQYNIPNPSFVRRTMWNKNQWTYGSYGSYVTNEGYESGLRSRAPFRKVLPNKDGHQTVFWAGEHTHDTRAGGADGAYASGIRVAHEVARALEVNPSFPSPSLFVQWLFSYVQNIFGF